MIHTYMLAHTHPQRVLNDKYWTTRTSHTHPQRVLNQSHTHTHTHTHPYIPVHQFQKLHKFQKTLQICIFFFNRYAKTSKALALLLRQRIYHHAESGLQYFNEKSGWTQVEKVLPYSGFRFALGFRFLV